MVNKNVTMLENAKLTQTEYKFRVFATRLGNTNSLILGRFRSLLFILYHCWTLLGDLEASRTQPRDKSSRCFHSLRLYKNNKMLRFYLDSSWILQDTIGVAQVQHFYHTIMYFEKKL